jgi:elongation factor Ts
MSAHVRLASRSMARWTMHAGKQQSPGPFYHGSDNVTAAFTSPFRSSTRSFADFSMSTLKDLRSQSGAPIVECKKALEHAGDDLAAAMDWLREHGAAKASAKLQGRETSEGLVGISISADGKTASLVKVASETDFAGRSSLFVDLVGHVANATLLSSSDGALSEATILESTLNGKSVKEALDDAIVAIRENLSVPDAKKIHSQDGIVVGYVHNRVDSSDAGTSAALVEVSRAAGSNVSDEVLQSTGRKLAMHIVAARPLYLSPDNMPTEEVEKEKETLNNEIGDSGKPADIVKKIVAGRMRKFYEGVCLTEQAHMIEDQNPKVSKFLKDLGIELKRFESLSIS